ncbi:hypothetical protein BGZ54_010449, partial [Gamsiella multidivaricata]
MKVACLLPLPLLLVPFTHAADYLVRFKEGPISTTTTSSPEGVSRIQSIHSQDNSAHPKFDYDAKELSLTVLSLSQAKALAEPHHKAHHGKSKAQVETSETKSEEGAQQQQQQGAKMEIKSKGRWFTFDDSQFHVWHGDFSEEEAELLVDDVGVELMEKDIEIRFAELERYANVTARTLTLEQAFEQLGPQEIGLKTGSKIKRKELVEDEVSIPHSTDDEQDESEDEGGQGKDGTPPHESGKKTHEAKEYVSPVTASDLPGPSGAYMIQQHAPSW